MATFSALQSSYGAGEMAPGLCGRVDLAKYRVGLKRQRNMFTVVHGGSMNRAGTIYSDKVIARTVRGRLVPFKYSTTDTYTLEFGDMRMRVRRNGAYVLNGTKAISAITQAANGQVTAAGHGYSTGDRVFLTGIGGMTQLNGRSANITVVDANNFTIGINTSGYGAYSGGGTSASYYTLVTPYAAADLQLLKFTQSFDKVTITHAGYEQRTLTRSGHAAWSLSVITMAPETAAPTGFISSTGGGSVFYAVTAINDESGEESLPLLGNSATNNSTLTWVPTAGCSRYNIYNLRQGMYGFIGSSGPTGFTDNGILSDTTITPPQARNPFGGPGEYPSCSSFFGQRATYAGSANKPQTFWASVAGALSNMSVSQPTQGDDAITKTIASREVNAIRNMVPLDDLLLFTSGGLWRGAATGSDGVTAASLEFKQQTYEPISHIAPIVIHDDVLFPHEFGSVVYRVSFEAVSTRWRPSDISVLARHLFENMAIVDWCYAAVPFNIIWAVRSDGKLLSLTYLKEQEVYAWSWHDTDGFVESICSIPEGSENVVEMIVRRTVNGVEERFVERLASRTFNTLADGWFLDCALRYSGAPATVISGLHHLEGRTVTALADGIERTGLVVTNGAVTLPVAAGIVLVGLPYLGEMQTLGVETQPTIQGRPRTVKGVTLNLLDSHGGQVGPDFDSLSNINLNGLADPVSATELHTGERYTKIESDGWGEGGSICIRQSGPFPMHVISDVIEVTVG